VKIVFENHLRREMLKAWEAFAHGAEHMTAIKKGYGGGKKRKGRSQLIEINSGPSVYEAFATPGGYSAEVVSGLSTSSTYAMGALSPARKPIFKMRT
jgi:hypothetical protein